MQSLSAWVLLENLSNTFYKSFLWRQCLLSPFSRYCFSKVGRYYNPRSRFQGTKWLKVCNFVKQKLQHRSFLVKLAHTFKNTYFEEHLRTAASVEVLNLTSVIFLVNRSSNVSLILQILSSRYLFACILPTEKRANQWSNQALC